MTSINIKLFLQERKDAILKIILALGIGLIGFYYYDSYAPALFEVARDFMVFGVIYATYEFSKQRAADSNSSNVSLYYKALFYCGIIAGIISQGLGSHHENGDPLFGGGDRIIDYVTTGDETAQYFWWVFIILYLPAANGISKRLNK